MPGLVQQRFYKCPPCARTEINTKDSKLIKTWNVKPRGPTLYPGAVLDSTVDVHGISEGLRNSSFKVKIVYFH